MEIDLDKKVVIITGGAGLLGVEFVKAVSSNNGVAIIADLDEVRGKQVAQAVFKKCDITNKDSINSVLNDVKKEQGRVDALVNGAYPKNKNFGRKLEDVTYQDFCENVNLHLGGYFLTAQQAAIFFKKQGHGNIINIASIYGLVPPKFGIYEKVQMTMPVEYAAIKSAIIQLTRYMAKYYKDANLRVNSISPGGILDGQAKDFLDKYKEQCLSKGMLDKSDITGTLLYLLSDMSKYVNGQNIIIDDGFTL
jgi:NAD(P)-dependent dehydrogenase (short-subunit alcohol dehydrogenase family)